MKYDAIPALYPCRQSRERRSPAPARADRATAVLLLALSTLPAAQPAAAETDGAQFAKSKNCMACHAIGNKVVGPGYRDVAKRYAGQPDATEKLVQKVLKGGAGAWGVVPMPANTQVSEAEARTLVSWILSLK